MLSKYIRNVVDENSFIGSNGLSFLTGDSNQITKNNALRNSSIIYACVDKIASTIAKMSIELYKRNGNSRERVTNDLSLMVSNRPYKYYSTVDFIQVMISLMLLNGQSFAMVETKKGTPSELIVLPSSTYLQKIDNKYIVITTVDNEQYALDYNKVLHFKDMTKDGINCISRIDCIKNKANTQLRGEKMVDDFYANGGGIKGFLEEPSKLGREAKEKLKKATMDLLTSGVNGIGVLDAGLTYKPVATMSIADTQFIDNMKLTKEEICSVFGLNPALVGASDNTSFNNMQEMNLNFIQSLMTLLVKMEQEMDYKLLTPSQRKQGYYFRFNQSCALRADDKSRADFYSTMVNNGLMAINECRAKENLNPVKGGDTIRVDLNHVSLDKADEYQMLKAKSGKEVKKDE